MFVLPIKDNNQFSHLLVERLRIFGLYPYFLFEKKNVNFQTLIKTLFNEL